MVMKLNPATGLFEDMPETSDAPPKVSDKLEEPLTKIPDAVKPATPITPIPPVIPPVVETPVETKSQVDTSKLTDKQKLYLRITDTLREFDGESNIPVTHDYWKWVNEYRSLR